MALSQVIIPGDGVTTLVTVDFALGYIDTDQITCRVGDEVDGAGNPVYRNFTFQSATLVQVDGPPATVEQNYVFERIMPKDELIVDWENDDPITRENLNTAQKQALMMTHEALDGVARSIKVPVGRTGYVINPDIAPGHVLEVQPNGVIGEGPNSDNIINAQGYADEAEGYRDQVQQWRDEILQGIAAPIYETVQGMSLVSVPLLYDTVRVNWYAARGDNGGGTYKRVATQPTHAGRFQDALGAWFELTGVFVWPEQFGAKGDGFTVDTTAVQAALVASRIMKGSLLLPAKTYLTRITVENADRVYGVDMERSVIKLPNGANADVIIGKDAYALLANPAWGNAEEGANRVTLENFTIDGNRANNTAGAGIFIWGYGLRFDKLQIKNINGIGMHTAFYDGNLPMEGTFTNILIDTVGEHGWLNSGPHDMHVSNVRIVSAGAKADNTYDGLALYQNGNNGTNGRFYNVHVWHRSTDTNRCRYALNAGSFGANEFFGCHFEGCRKQVLITSQGNRFSGCNIYNSFGTAGTALVELGSNANTFSLCNFGNAGTQTDVFAIDFYNNTAGNQIIGCYFSGFRTRSPFKFTLSGGENVIRGRGFAAAGGATTFTGTPHASDEIVYYQGGTFINYVKWVPLSAFADNAAATAGGIPVGGLYRNSATNAVAQRV